MDNFYLAPWWFLFFLIGIVNLPLTLVFFKKFYDAGYGLAKILGLLLTTYLCFLGATSHFIPFTAITTYLFFFFLLIINGVIFFKNKRGIIATIRAKSKIIIFQEVIFILCLAGWSMVRGYAPEARGLEKFMDLGFINSILRSPYLPAPDMWFAGSTINYYWFGHFMTAVATRLSFTPSFVSYNLMVATILGLLACGVFSLVATLFSTLPKKVAGKAFAAGIISLILVCFAGNFHTPIYIYKNGLSKYWYPDATRFIGYSPETNDKTIHEFPIYSFVVSDLHAHLLDIPLVILFLAFLWQIVAEEKEKSFKDKLKQLLLPGLTLGGMFMTNTWDFGNYLVAAASSLFLIKIIHGRPSWQKFIKAVGSSAVTLAILIVFGILTAVPFILNFVSITQGVKFVHSHTPLWQLGVLWGFPMVLTIVFLLLIFLKLKGKIQKADVFILSFLITGWILVFIPELVYVKDIYISSHYRANTMFKLTYQAYVMFYLTGGYIASRIISKMTGFITKTLSTTFFLLLFMSLLIYPFLAVGSYYNDLRAYRGLSGETWLKSTYPDLYQVIAWLGKNVNGQPAILEAPGDSYTDYDVVSSYTGLPTVNGWFVHEWLWRGGPEVPAGRGRDVETIYTTASSAEAKSLLAKYQVRYIIVGQFEREKYPSLNESKFLKIGKKVFSSGETAIYYLNN